MSLKDVIPGYSNPTPGVCHGAFIKIALYDDLGTIPELPARANDFTDDGTDTNFTTISGDFVFTDAVNDGFARIRIKPKSGSISAEAVGEEGSRSVKNVFAFSIDGASDAAEAFMARMLNRPVIAVVPEADGNDRVMGSTCYPAILQAGTATNPADPESGFKGMTFELYYYDLGKAPKFTGAAPLIP